MSARMEVPAVRKEGVVGLWVHLGTEMGPRWACDEGWAGIKVLKNNTDSELLWSLLLGKTVLSLVPSLLVAPALNGRGNPSPVSPPVSSPLPPTHGATTSMPPWQLPASGLQSAVSTLAPVPLRPGEKGPMKSVSSKSCP